MEFFHESCKVEPIYRFRPTLVLCPEAQDDGGVIMVEKVLEKELASDSGLSFDDFSISECLKRGIKLHSLSINPDLRIGSDGEIVAFNEHLEEIASNLFNSEN